MKINELIEYVWKNPKIEKAELFNYIVKLEQDQKDKVLNLHSRITKTTQPEIVSSPDNKKNNEVNDKKIRDVIIALYLAEHRLDEMLFFSTEEQSIFLEALLNEWSIDKELLMPIYLDRSAIKKEVSI